jgi:type IV pilus assembly protein PilF
MGCITTGEKRSSTIDTAEASQVNLNLGIGYIRQGRFDLAREKLEKALRQNPELAEAYSALALVYDNLGEPASAEENFRTAVQLAPENSSVLNTYAVFLCRQRRGEEAEAYFLQAATNPRYTTPEAALTNAGVCMLQMGDAEQAETYFRDALAKNSRFPDALFQLTVIAYDRDNLLQARAFLQRYLAAAPPNPQILWLGFRIERGLGDERAAERYGGQLKTKFPESTESTQLRELERRVGAN